MGNSNTTSPKYEAWADTVQFKNEKGKIINHKSVRGEQPEQVMAFDTPSTCKVVELGARYGTVSVALSAQLDDPTQHIAVEADPKVWDALRQNREANGAAFTQVNGVIGDAPLCLSKTGYNTTTSTCDASTPGAIQNYTLDELGADDYTCLVADCEGCVPDFLDSNARFAKNMKYASIEMDGNRANNARTRELLRSNGLRRVSGFSKRGRPVSADRNAFREIWKK